MDPNWLYSSLAQSAASIVGLFGAILATRLQAQLERAAEQQVRATAALRKLNEAVRPMFERLSLYAEKAPSQLERIRDAINRNLGDFTASPWYSPYDLGADNVRVGANQHCLDVESARTALAKASLPHLSSLLAATERKTLEDFGSEVEPLLNDAAEGMPQQFRMVAQLATEAAAQLAQLSIRSESGSFNVLWAFLVFLSLGGVVVPLAFLTAYRALDRFVLVGVLTAGLGALLVFIKVQIRQLCDLRTYHALLPPAPKRDGAA